MHNAVLLPKIEFRLKACLLSEQEYDVIQRPFRRLFKTALRINSAIPNPFIHAPQALNILNLYHRLLSNFIVRYSNWFSLPNSSVIRLSLMHHLHYLKIELFIPCSLLEINNPSSFSATPLFQVDSLLRTLIYAFPLGIRFAAPVTNMTAPWKNTNHTPICDLFVSNPKLYQSSLRLFKKHNIQFLSDCLSPDGLALLPFREIIKKNSDFHPSQITPKWFHYLKDFTAITDGSSRLQPQYTEAHHRLHVQLTDS